MKNKHKIIKDESFDKGMSEISKRDYRQRAHANPFKDSDITIPKNPSSIDWSKLFENGKFPTFLDIGCGYGKFIMDLSKKSTENVLGLEIRDKVTEYVKAKIIENNLTNCAIIKTNALLFLPNFFKKNSLKKVFVLFPDPHFKKRKQKGRVICRQMISTIEYILNDTGKLYISTDVELLFNDMRNVILESKLFREVQNKEEDCLYTMTFKNTDEAFRAGVKTGKTFASIFEKI